MKLNQYQWDPENDKIGEGSFAEVFKAKDNIGDSVALKVYRESVVQTSTGGSLKGKYSLENEFSKGKHLSHTNVIRYIALDYLTHINFMGRQESLPVLIMEYADAGSLETLLNPAAHSSGDTIAVNLQPRADDLLKIAQGVLEGMAYLHSQGIIHRDLKPANILFKTDRTGIRVVKITDFGISRDSLAKNTTGSTTIGIGTVSYMAPEQFMPKKFGIDGAIGNYTDVWAFGIILYRMLSGKLPFATQEEITGMEPDYGKVPAPYHFVIKGCLQKFASKRFSDAATVLKALSALQPDPQGPPSQSVNRSPLSNPALPQPKASWYAVNKRAVNLAGVIIASVILAVCIAFFPGVFKSNEPEYVTNKILQLTDTLKGESFTYTYTGWLKNGVPNGQGTKLFKNGDKYVGESLNGLASGNGKRYYKVDGGYDTFEGEFKRGVPDGSGTYLPKRRQICRQLYSGV